MYKAQSSARCHDVLVLGSGIAGLLLTDLLARRGMGVLLACKGKLADSNTTQAQGGLAAVTGANPVDSPELHLKDTLSSGAGLTHENVARRMVSRGADLVRMLTELGVNFDNNKGTSDVALEGGHSRARVLHSKDASGRAITSSLIDRIREHERVTVWEDAFAMDLLVHGDRCTGALILLGGELVSVSATHTVLATGGVGQVFSRTTNPAVATGDGIAMAYRAGAKLIDMEFVQFHPTALSLPGKPADLISEAVRGAGATLLDRDAQRFVFRYHKDGELATRDIVARAIYKTMIEQDSDAVMLDMRPIGKDQIAEKFPNILKKCLERGLDPTLAPIPIAPAAHYFMGGIWTDVTGSTSIPGLYAIGECASTGLHGANRLASNSLLEGGVMALELAEVIGSSLSLHSTEGVRAASEDNKIKFIDLQTFRASMFKLVGLERTASSLIEIVKLFDEAPANAAPSNQQLAEQQNIELVGWLIAQSALQRRESRGAHWRSDYPAINDRDYLKRYYTSLTESGWLDMAQPFAAPGTISATV